MTTPIQALQFLSTAAVEYAQKMDPTPQQCTMAAIQEAHRVVMLVLGPSPVVQATDGTDGADPT